MARIVLLDSGPLGLLSRAGHRGDECRRWLADLIEAGVSVRVPDIAHYEVFRELLRREDREPEPLARLERVVAGLGAEDISRDAWRRAESLWAQLRRAGKPTAGDEDLDGDTILAAVALTIGAPGDMITVATTNIRHLGRLPGVDAREWRTIRS